MTLPIDVMPYVRMTQKGKWKPQAQKYLASQGQLRLLLQNQMQHGLQPIPDKTPFYLRVVFYEPVIRHNRDVDNMVKAVLDAAQGICFVNDMWCDDEHGRRETAPDGKHSVYIEIGERL